jgi:hypothetical protein
MTGQRGLVRRGGTGRGTDVDTGCLVRDSLIIDVTKKIRRKTYYEKKQV